MQAFSGALLTLVLAALPVAARAAPGPVHGLWLWKTASVLRAPQDAQAAMRGITPEIVALERVLLQVEQLAVFAAEDVHELVTLVAHHAEQGRAGQRDIAGLLGEDARSRRPRFAAKRR